MKHEEALSIESYSADDSRTGYRIPAIHCRDFNAACDRFMRSRGQKAPSDFKFGFQPDHKAKKLKQLKEGAE